MARFEDLLKDISAEVPGCPEPVMDRELHDAAYDFCRRTGIWREELEPVTPKANVAVYEFVAPFEARVEKVEWGYYGTTQMHFRKESQIRAANHRAEDDTGEPRNFALVRGDRNQFVVNPIPGSSETGKDFVFYALLLPTRASTEAPDWLFDEWQDALVHGALERLMRQRAEWGEPQAAQMHGQLFRQEIARAKREALTGYGAQGQVKMQRFGA